MGVPNTQVDFVLTTSKPGLRGRRLCACGRGVGPDPGRVSVEPEIALVQSCQTGHGQGRWRHAYTDGMQQDSSSFDPGSGKPVVKSLRFNPQRLDVAAFARAGAELAGEWSPASLSRLFDGTAGPADGADRPVTWSARGCLKPVTGGAAEVWLELKAAGAVWLECQRCLQPTRIDLVVDRSIRFVASEEEAERLDEEGEHDVLAMTRALNLAELVEDELILALPIVPRHVACPQPLPLVQEADVDGIPALADSPDLEPAPERPNPFAVLASLKQRR